MGQKESSFDGTISTMEKKVDRMRGVNEENYHWFPFNGFAWPYVIDHFGQSVMLIYN